jgi:tRNA A-37 threonylcarbamoyl transferase component Bud32
MTVFQREPIVPCPADNLAVDAAVEAFEAAWRAGGVPFLRTFIDGAAAGPTDRLPLLYELICLDLEYRWRGTACESEGGAAAPLRYRLEDYVLLLPELGPLGDLPLDLVAEEYYVRHRWGDRPDALEFAGRFPGRGAELTAALANADRELQKEGDSSPTVSVVDGHSSTDVPGLAGVPQFELSDFVLEAHLGSGGIGKVYRAWWKSKKRPVAVKVLRKNWWHRPGVDALFLREAAILVRLRHANIVSVHGIGRIAQGGCFLVLELIDGGDLTQHLDGRVPLTRALDWVAQAAAALAHRRGVIHRDVKPANLLLDRFGRIHVADFGLALGPAAGGGSADDIAGTVAYMAPEQFFGGQQPVGPAADLFSLGAVLHALLTGHPPSEGFSYGTELFERRRKGSLTWQLPTLRPNLPEAVEEVVKRCLQVDPVERFTTADELALALRTLLR